MLHWCKKRLEEIKTLDHNKKTIVGESQTLQEPGIAMAQNGKQILTQVNNFYSNIYVRYFLIQIF